jgi:hypothetical protein
MCWALSDGSSKLIPIDEQPNHQIVHLFRLGKAQRATHEPLNLGPEIDVLALDFLRVLLAYVMLLWVNMPRVTDGASLLLTIKPYWHSTNQIQPSRGARTQTHKAGSHATGPGY